MRNLCSSSSVTCANLKQSQRAHAIIHQTTSSEQMPNLHQGSSSPRSHCFRYERRCSKIDAVRANCCARGVEHDCYCTTSNKFSFLDAHTRGVWMQRAASPRLPARLNHPTPVVVVHNTQYGPPMIWGPVGYHELFRWPRSVLCTTTSTKA
jgi:hypothetical protein